MKNKVLFVVCLVYSMSLSAETLKTDNSNRYLKNYNCNNNGNASFNAVNKSSKYWTKILFKIYDADGDPVDNFEWYIRVGPNNGEKLWRGGCNKLKNVRYTATGM